jgi:hypothetical protein
MKVWVFPVSGGSFPKQLGLLDELIEQNTNHTNYGDKPDVSLASSGGNVSVYTALAGDYSIDGIERISRMLNSNLFLSSWWPGPVDFLPSWTIGFFRGAAYNHGYGVDTIFNQIFTNQTIGREEIWTGTTNMDVSRAQLFCNRSKDKSVLNMKNFDPPLVGCTPPIYLDSNVDKIAQVSIASASIPTVVPEQEVDGMPLYDGGVLYASPLTPLQNVIQGQREGLHIIYFSSFDMDSECPPGSEVYTMSQIGTTTFDEIIRGLCVKDRLTGVELIKSFGVVKTKSVIVDNRARERDCIEKDDIIVNGKLSDMLALSKNSYSSLLELYPIGNENDSLNLASFTGEDVVALLEKTRKHYGVRLWYV